MILLNSTSAVLQIASGLPPSQVQVQASWIDTTFSSSTPGTTNTIISTETTTTVVPSPADGVSRSLMSLAIQNTDPTYPVSISVQHYDGTTTVALFSYDLPAGFTVHFDEGNGWYVVNAAGAIVTSGGGATTPGGDNGEIQGNDEGSFGGVPGSFLDFVNGLMSLAPVGTGVALSLTGDGEGSDIFDTIRNSDSAKCLSVDSDGNVSIAFGLKDSTDSLGTDGQVLSSTGSATEWKDASGGSPTTPGVGGFWAISLNMPCSVSENPGNISANNSIRAILFTLPYATTISGLAVYVGDTSAVSCVFDIGLYDAATGAGILNSNGSGFGGSGLNGSSTGQVTATFSEVTIPAGQYLIAWTATAASNLDTFGYYIIESGGANSSLQQEIVGSFGGGDHFVSSDSATGGILPSSLTLAHLSVAGGYDPPATYFKT